MAIPLRMRVKMEQALEKEEEARRLRSSYVEQLQQQIVRELQLPAAIAWSESWWHVSQGPRPQ